MSSSPTLLSALAALTLSAGLGHAPPVAAASAPGLAAGECSNWEPAPSSRDGALTTLAIAAANDNCSGTYDDQRDQCFWRDANSQGVSHAAGWQCVIKAGNDGAPDSASAEPSNAGRAPNLASGECSNWEPAPSSSEGPATGRAIAAANAACPGTYDDQRDQCFWREADSQGVSHASGWQCVIATGQGGQDGEPGPDPVDPPIATGAPNLGAGQCSNWEPAPSSSGGQATAGAIAAANARCSARYDDQRDQCFWRDADSQGVAHAAGWQCVITDGRGGSGSPPEDTPAAQGSFDVSLGGWSKHPWSHDFDSADDLDHWHAQDTLGSRDPDDRHVGKQTQASGQRPVANTREFSKVASVDVARGELVMSSFFENGEAKMSYLRSFAAFDTIDDGRPVDWTADYPRSCTTSDGLEATLPCDFILDPSADDYYVETRVSFEEANDAYKTWWAFWLYSEASHYDDDVDTGMEVDILEYVPYAAEDGFNAALFRDDDGRGRADVIHPPVSECGANDSPGSTPCDTFTANAPDTDSFLRAASAEYDACRVNGSCPAIRLDEGYHRIGLLYSRSAYVFYLDGYKFWEVTDREWITQTAELGIYLTWEKDEGNATEDGDGNGIPGYLDDLAPGNGSADGVADWRRSSSRSPLGYGTWNQGWKNPVIYEGTCRVREIGSNGSETFTFSEAADRGIDGNDLEIVEGTNCSFRTHEDYYSSRGLESIVRVDYVHVWTRD